MTEKKMEAAPGESKARSLSGSGALHAAGRKQKREFFLLQKVVPIFTAVCVFSVGVLGGGALWLPALAALAAAAVVGVLLHKALQKLSQERSSLDEQLFQSQKLAALGEMAAGIAHEINTPLAIIASEADWMEHLLTKPADDGQFSVEQFRESLQQVNSQVQRCAEITHSILGFAAKRKAVAQRVDLKKLTDDMARWIEREAKQRNIQIIRDYSQQVPEVTTDPPLLRQVLLNLLNNAYQAVDKNGFIRIAIFKQSNEIVCIEVRDNGCGISQQDIGKIFNPFFTTKSPGKGTGLGLSISLAIITRLGGTLSVISKPGEGTAFTISLPIKGQVSEDKE